MIKLLKSLWAKEPVLVAEIIPLGVTAGVLTQAQASTLTATITGVVAAVVQVAAAFGVRSLVTSPATKAKQAVAAKP